MNIADYLLNGQLRAYSSIGGYPIVYLNSQGSAFCANCANEELENIRVATANWENPSLFCDGCGQRIESAYAETEA
ncbi:MAG: hypothetical protein WBG32_18895 [Nodosilinea sp.]